MSRESQRATAVAELTAGRSAVVVGPDGGEGARALPDAARVTVAAVLDGGAPDADAVVVLDPVAPRLLVAVAHALADRAADGTVGVLAVGPGQERLLADVLPGAAVLRQVAAEAVWLGSGAPETVTVAVDDVDAATVRVLLVLGAEAPPPTTATAARPLLAAHHAALELELSELQAASARALSTHRPLESAAAGALVARAEAMEVILDDLRERLEQALASARQNDELFQEAREIIGERDREIRGLRVTLAKPQHRVAASAGYRLARVPGLKPAARALLRGRD